MLKVEKITLFVSSDTGNQAFDRIISMVQEGEGVGEYKLINYENPTEELSDNDKDFFNESQL